MAVTFLWWGGAACVSALVIEALLRFGLAHRIASDHPNARSLHTQVIPRIGGLGVMAAFLLLTPWASGPGLMSIVAALAALSLWDDRHGLPSLLRFAAHLAGAAALVFGVLPPMAPGLAVLMVLGLGWSTNLYNFMDGSDGLAGLMGTLGFGALAIAAPGPDLALPAWILSGATLGFLCFNAPPAKVFLGDCGSISLGFLAGSLGLAGWLRGDWPWWFPLLVFSAFFVDASVTLARRLARGVRVWEAHREHAYQRLVLAGLAKRQLLIAYGTLMLLSAASSVAALRQSVWVQHAILVLWCVIYAGLLLLVERIWRRHLAAQNRKTIPS